MVQQGKRRRARSIAVAAFLATATAGATIAGLTAANADEDVSENSPSPTESERPTETAFELTKAPQPDDPKAEGIGYDVDMLQEGLREACIEAGFSERNPTIWIDGHRVGPTGHFEAAAEADCSKPYPKSTFEHPSGSSAATEPEREPTETGFEIMKAPQPDDPEAEIRVYAAGGTPLANFDAAVRAMFEGARSVCVSAGFPNHRPSPTVWSDGPVERSAGGFEAVAEIDCSKPQPFLGEV
jgi:hypothetical protein